MNVNVQNAHIANIDKSLNKLNCPVNAYIHAKAPINKTPLPGTSDAFNFPNALYPGIIF